MERALRIGGLANARDLGGLARRGGAMTPEGVFIRSEGIDRVGAEGWRALHAYDVRAVIDLRRPDERTGDVPASFAHVRVDLDGDEVDFWAPYETDGRWGTPLYYRAHLRELPHRLTGALDAIASADEGAILFHCSAGWDRTGLLAAVLLRALDVDADAAVADYLASFSNAEVMQALHRRSFDADERHRVLAQFGHTAESAFRDVYENLDLEAWFRVASVAPATQAAVTTWRGAVTAP